MLLHGSQMLTIVECMHQHESQGMRVKALMRDVLVWVAGSLHGSRGFTNAVSVVASILESEQPPSTGSMLVSGSSCQATACSC